MSLDWPSAALRSLALSLRAGRPAVARIWLCRHRIAARTSSTFCAVGIRSVLVHGTAAALALTVFLEPSATVALTVVSFLWLLAWAAGAATKRPVVTTAAMTFFVSTVATSMSRCVGSYYVVPSTRRAVRHESFGSPAGSWSPVALRPVLANGLPLSGS